jgi:hypothetical protein
MRCCQPVVALLIAVSQRVGDPPTPPPTPALPHQSKLVEMAAVQVPVPVSQRSGESGCTGEAAQRRRAAMAGGHAASGRPQQPRPPLARAGPRLHRPAGQVRRGQGGLRGGCLARLIWLPWLGVCTPLVARWCARKLGLFRSFIVSIASRGLPAPVRWREV